MIALLANNRQLNWPIGRYGYIATTNRWDNRQYGPAKY
jgi:hypothetical protein